MAFKFETAHDRWSQYKQSIMEHPQYVPGINDYINGGSKTVPPSKGSEQAADQARRVLPAENVHDAPAYMSQAPQIIEAMQETLQYKSEGLITDEDLIKRLEFEIAQLKNIKHSIS